MSLEYAILGFLNYRTYSGYDLKKIFDASVRQQAVKSWFLAL
jgi:DNA-binding PadR family transcriptional regulator